jgi:hypothetical protein
MDVKKIMRELLALSTKSKKIMEKENKEFVEFIKKSLTDKLNETLKHPSFGNPRNRTPGFQGAKPMVNTKITANPKGGYTIEVKAFMAKGVSNQRHFVWHVINRGRKPYTAKRWQTFPLRIRTRTIPNEYYVDTFPGWSGEWVSIAPGKTVGGIEGRFFYKAIIDELTWEIKLNYPNIEIIKLKDNN